MKKTGLTAFADETPEVPAEEILTEEIPAAV